MTDGQDEQTWLDEIIEMKRVKNRTIIERMKGAKLARNNV